MHSYAHTHNHYHSRMEFKQLPSNPLAKNRLQLFPFLEPNPNIPIIIPKTEPIFYENHPNMHKFHYKKKPKYIHPSQNPHKYQTPPRMLQNLRNPAKQAPVQAFPSTEPSRNVTSAHPRNSIVFPTPTLVKLTNTGKLNRMLRNSQPGMMVFLRQREELHCILMAAKWENYIIYRGPNYYTHLIAEFYANMEIKQRENVFYFSSFVNGKNIYVDHHVLNKALRLGNRPSDMPCINIFEKFVFNQNEFELFLGFFCEEDVPLGICAKNCGINFRHFIPKFQMLAIILRANILPKPKHDQFFDFIDLKVMFQLVTNSVEFNINYVLILNMIYAHIIDYMPFGLLLTSIFESHYVQMSRIHANRIDYCCVDQMVQPRIPLTECKPNTLSLFSFPSLLLKTDNFDSLKTEVSNLTKEMSLVKEFNGQLLLKINQLEMKMEKSEGKRVIEVGETSKVCEVQLENELVVGGVDENMCLPEVDEVLAAMCENA